MSGKARRGLFTLDAKLKLLVLFMLLPVAVLVVFLLDTMIKYTGQYDQIVYNVVTASEFNRDFKYNLDYKMYRRVVSGERMIDGQNAYDVYDPTEELEGARAVVRELRETSTHPDSVRIIRDCEHFLTNLERYIDNVQPHKTWAYNMDLMLEANIRVVTTLLQDRMTEYIFLETINLKELQRATSEEIGYTVYLISGVAVALFLIIWVVAMLIAGGISRPIKKLCDSIQTVGEGNLTFRPVKSFSYEIQTLSKSFQNMVERVELLMEHVKQEQVNLRRTELMLLQAQINPHFLYNTFDTIIWLAEDNQTQSVVEITTSLSQFFRTTLSRGRDFITLQEEVLHIRSYLEIQSVRYQDILEYAIDIPKEFYSYTLPKLTLQPLVENALYHGIKNKRGIGKITIGAAPAGEGLALTVRDDGVGMTPEELRLLNASMQEPQSRNGFGVANVHERIRLYFGKEYGVSFHSEKGAGTTATVRIALQA